MNTTYFLNLVSGNVFGSKKTPALPEKYYLGLSSAAPALTGGNLLMYGELSASRRVEAATIMTIKLGSLNLSVVNPTA